MSNAANYAALGQKVDLAVQHRDRAAGYLAAVKKEGLEARIRVAIDKSNFGDGSGQLAEKLTVVLKSRLTEMVEEAMAMIEDDADAALTAMQAAFGPGPRVDVAPMGVPAGTKEPIAPALSGLTAPAAPAAPTGRRAARS